MNIPPSELDRMDLWTYEALLHQWNEAHSTDGIEAPDAERAQKLIDRINADPRLTNRTRELTH